MKAFNKIKSLFVLFLLLGFVACQEEKPEWKPAPQPGETLGVYFPTTNRAAVELEPTAPTEIMITIARTDTVNAAEVPITVVVNDENVYVVPEKVTFAALEKTTQFKVTFPTAGEGTAYKLSLKVEGEQYVNTYGLGAPFVNTQITRIKWTLMSEPFVFMEPVGNWGYNIPSFPMYVETYKAVTANSTRYRLKNAYRITTDAPDADGIYDGYPDNFLAASPYTDDYYFDDSSDRYITLEIAANGAVSMLPSNTGFYFDPHEDGVVTIGTVLGNISNSTTYVLGRLNGGVITFPTNSLYVNLALAGNYVLPPSKIYLTKEAYLVDNRKITDFNKIEYDEIEGAVSEFESPAYKESWGQKFFSAVDIDEENKDSEYKNLYYLADLYAKNYGLAFYYNGEDLVIPANQRIGTAVFGKNLFVSPSTTVKSSVVTTAKGVTVYTFGLKFHYTDGTVLGDFAETYFYSEDPIEYSIDDFCGNYTVTGTSLFGGAALNRSVTIEKGKAANTLIIKGFPYIASLEAEFDADDFIMSISSQEVDDFIADDFSFEEMEFLTFKAPNIIDWYWEYSLSFTINLKGQLNLTSNSGAVGYVLYAGAITEDGEDEGDDLINGWYNLSFTPRAASSSAVSVKSATQPVPVYKTNNKDLISISVEKKEKCSNGNFSIQPKVLPNKLPF